MLLGLLAAACTGLDEARRLTPKDVQLMDGAVQRALETNKVGEGSNWSNPDSGHAGTVTPLRTVERWAGRPCRDYQQTATVAGETEVAYDTACRRPNGDWESLHYGGLAGFGSYRPSYPRGFHHDPYWDPHFGYPYRCRWPCYGYPRFGADRFGRRWWY